MSAVPQRCWQRGGWAWGNRVLSPKVGRARGPAGLRRCLPPQPDTQISARKAPDCWPAGIQGAGGQSLQAACTAEHPPSHPRLAPSKTA